MFIVESLFIRRLKKLTILFPSEFAMWRFFETSELREFKLDSAKCTVTGRFLSTEIERAKMMNAIEI
jgi:hypothetical protein